MSQIAFPEPIVDVEVTLTIGMSCKLGNDKLLYGGLLSVSQGVLHFLLNVRTFEGWYSLCLRMYNNANREVGLEGSSGDIHCIKILDATDTTLTFSYIKLERELA